MKGGGVVTVDMSKLLGRPPPDERTDQASNDWLVVAKLPAGGVESVFRKKV